MSKAFYEVAAEVVQEVFRARSQAIAGVEHLPSKKELIEKYLSDEAVVATYDVVTKAIKENY
ncbi:hypothetical protein AB4114_08195 [Paenibacillus sp. 2RAB27]|uniref:hypothetical protein n=1 Tax=Paenibacillus sp. 2RAB27 TaxID=3232991 RepID=UPI003F9CF3CD